MSWKAMLTVSVSVWWKVFDYAMLILFFFSVCFLMTHINAKILNILIADKLLFMYSTKLMIKNLLKGVKVPQIMNTVPSKFCPIRVLLYKFFPLNLTLQTEYWKRKCNRICFDYKQTSLYWNWLQVLPRMLKQNTKKFLFSLTYFSSM